MTDNTLDRLFEQARNEAVETHVDDVRKWIGLVTFGAIVLAALTKIKLLVTKNLVIMLTSTIVTTGIGVAVIVAAVAPTEHSEKKPLTPATNQYVLPDAPAEESVEESKELDLFPIQPLHRKQESNADIDALELRPVEYDRLIPVSASEDRRLIFQDPAPINTVTSVPQSIGSFNSMNIRGAVHVVLTQGDVEDVRIEGTQEGKDATVVKNTSGTLHIYTDTKGKNCKECDAVVYVTFKEIKKVEISGASTLENKNEWRFSDLFIETSGASNVDLNMVGEKLRLDCSGASNLELEGTVKALMLDNSGASHIEAHQLKATDVKIDCSGASSSTVYVSGKFDAEVSGASEVRYKGNPTNSNKSVSGVSSCRQF